MKRLPALVCALFIFICLCSCSAKANVSGPAADAGSGVPEQEMPPASDAADREETSDGPAVRHARTIAIRMKGTPVEEDAMRMLADDFNASNGQGITVVVRNESKREEEGTDDGTEGEADGETAKDAGDDTAALLLDDVKNVRSTKGLQSLNERIAADFGNNPDVPAGLRTEAEKAGEQFGVPFDLDGGIFYYNAALYEAYGLEPPATWDDLLHAGEVLAKEEELPVMVTDSLTDLADLLLRLKGVSLTDGTRANFNSNAGHETFSFLMELLNEDYLLLADKGTCRDRFLEERCAGYIGTGSELSGMFRNSLFPIGAVPVPHPEGQELVSAPCTMRVLALYPGDKEQQDAAWAFVRYLTGASVSARWAVATGRFPVRAAAYLEPEYTGYMETSVAANASTKAQYGYYLPQEYSEDLQYRVREIIGRNMKSNVTGSEIAQILSEEINDSLASD